MPALKYAAAAAAGLALAAWAALAAAGGAQQPAPPLATLSGGSVRLTGDSELDAAGRLRVFSGAAIDLAGPAARLDLVRGGAVSLCGPARVSLAAGGTSAAGGAPLLLSLEQGGFEMRYAAGVADSVLTPDFRVTTIVPPDQLATVSASLDLHADGALCVMNRGSALKVEGLFDSLSQFVINGQSVLFHPGAPPTPVAECPCAAPQPTAPPPGAAAGALFPQSAALQYNANQPPAPAPVPAAPPAAAAPAAQRHRNFLVRFARWFVGKPN